MKRALLLILILAAVFSSCKTKKEENSGNAVKDDLGNLFEFPNPPERVISLAPSITEMIYYIGAESKLIGVTKYCDYPPEAKGKQSVGGLLDPNLELIAQMKPDLILLTIEGNSQITYKSLTDLGYRVFVLNPRKVDDIISSMEKLNEILKPKTGRTGIDNFRKEVESIKPKDTNRSTYAAFLSSKPLISFSDNTFIGDIFRTEGFANVFGSEKLDYPGIYDEDLLLKNPDYIFFLADTSGATKKIIETETAVRFYGLKAYKDKRVIILDENIFSRPGPRVADALKKLVEIRSQ
ncbi:MAG: helical backbone metal receptor [Ignavibacteria bacterium]